MDFLIQNFDKNEEFEKRIAITCGFNNAKCSFTQGKILNVKNTNINFVEPHKVDVTIKGKKLILIYFDKNNMFLYNRTMPITVKQLDTLLKSIKSEVA